MCDEPKDCQRRRHECQAIVDVAQEGHGTGTKIAKVHRLPMLEWPINKYIHRATARHLASNPCDAATNG